MSKSLAITILLIIGFLMLMFRPSAHAAVAAPVPLLDPRDIPGCLQDRSIIPIRNSITASEQHKNCYDYISTRKDGNEYTGWACPTTSPDSKCDIHEDSPIIDVTPAP